MDFTHGICSYGHSNVSKQTGLLSGATVVLIYTEHVELIYIYIYIYIVYMGAMVVHVDLYWSYEWAP